jgi:hypothetical protein
VARAQAADARDLAVLEDAQELGLHRERQLRELVEKERAPVGDFEQARFGLDRAGERPALVAEQLTLEEVLGEGGAVEAHVRRRGARRPPVDRVGDDVFAGARLAEEHDRQVALGHEVDDAVELAHRVVGHDDGGGIGLAGAGGRGFSRRGGGDGGGRSGGGLARAVDDEDRGADGDDLPALDGHARSGGNARAADGGAVGAAHVLDVDGAPAVEARVLARDRRVVDRDVARPRPADGDAARVGELLGDRSPGPHRYDVRPPRIEERVLLGACELVVARSHCLDRRTGRKKRAFARKRFTPRGS